MNSDQPNPIQYFYLVTNNTNRGGGWFRHSINCRGANRYRDPPCRRYEDLGFRLAINHS